MTEFAQIERWRRQRDFFAVAALVMLLAAIAACLPRAIARRHALNALRGELVELQNSIVGVQQQTRDTQAQLVQVQREIRTLLKQP